MENGATPQLFVHTGELQLVLVEKAKEAAAVRGPPVPNRGAVVAWRQGYQADGTSQPAHI